MNVVDPSHIHYFTCHTAYPLLPSGLNACTPLTSNTLSSCATYILRACIRRVITPTNSGNKL
jgi:hypothetical protein